ncbi:MAG: hypothetical protein ACLP7P_00390 [Rhodomicrobium sp.]
MSKNPPVFRPISAPLGVPDEALNDLGDRLGVPKMIKPEPASSPKIDAVPENPAIHSAPQSFRSTPSLEQKNVPLGQKRAPALAPIEPQTEKITVELPTYLTAALRREGAERRITTRTLVMMGLQALGFEVNERDLVPDGRRTRSRG